MEKTNGWELWRHPNPALVNLISDCPVCRHEEWHAPVARNLSEFVTNCNKDRFPENPDKWGPSYIVVVSDLLPDGVKVREPDGKDS